MKKVPALLLAAAVLAFASAAGRAAFARGKNTDIRMDAAAFAERDERDVQIAVWTTAFDADPQSALALGQLAGLHLQRAREGGGWDDYLRAENFARRSLALRTKRNWKTAATLASALIAQHRFVEARKVAGDLVAAEPDVPQYRAVLGEIAMELGDDSTAAVVFRSLWTERNHLSIAPRLARWLELNGQTSLAGRVLRGARDEAVSRRDVPAETKAWFELRLGELALRAGMPRTAGRAFRSGLVIEPNDPRLHAAMARLAAIRGHPREAIEWGTRAITTQLDPEVLGIIGESYELIGDTAKAEEYLRATRASVGAQPGPSHRVLSLHLLDQGENPEAILRAATNELSWRRDVYAYDLAAWAMHHAGRSDEAALLMRNALRLGTPDALLWYHDGMIARALGNAERAQGSLERALMINAAFHPVRAGEARAVLDSIARGR